MLAMGRHRTTTNYALVARLDGGARSGRGKPLARRRRENFGDIYCKSLHLGPEIDATHTLLTATYLRTCMYRLLRCVDDKSNCLAPLSARSLDCMAGIHSELEPEVKISLTESWIVASHVTPPSTLQSTREHKLSHHLRGVSRGSQGGHYTAC